jgi:hypothetical protein
MVNITLASTSPSFLQTLFMSAAQAGSVIEAIRGSKKIIKRKKKKITKRGS